MRTEALPPRLVAGRLPPGEAYDADIIILTMGRVEAALAAAESALRQADVSAYVAILDQAFSPEGGARFAALLRPYSRAGYFVAETNLGVGGGRNFLSGLGHGDVIVALDNDAVFGDAFVVAGAVDVLRGAPRLAAAGFRIMDRDGVGLDERSWGYPAALKAMSGGRFLTTAFVGAGHAIRRAAWEAAGGYDASLFFTWEEVDFALRAIALGWQVEYRGELCVFHQGAAEARVRWQGGRTRLFVRNRLIIARKWGASWLALAPRIGGYLVKGAWNGAFWAAVRGVAGAVARDGAVTKQDMPGAMRGYLRRHELAHRGTWFQRLRREVFARVSDAPAGARVVSDRSEDVLALVRACWIAAAALRPRNDGFLGRKGSGVDGPVKLGHDVAVDGRAGGGPR